MYACAGRFLIIFFLFFKFLVGSTFQADDFDLYFLKDGLFS